MRWTAESVVYVPNRYNDDGTFNQAYADFFDYDEQETRREQEREQRLDDEISYFKDAK